MLEFIWNAIVKINNQKIMHKGNSYFVLHFTQNFEKNIGVLNMKFWNFEIFKIKI